MAKMASMEKIKSARLSARASLRAVEENNKQIKALMRERYQCTGYAFVTFNKYQVAQAVLRELPKAWMGRKMQQRVSYLFGGHMQVVRAPEPADVIWENLQYSPREQIVRQVISTTFCLLLVLVGTVTIFVANLYVAPGMRSEGELSGATFLVLYLSSILLLAAGHIIVFAAVPFLAFAIERPHTNAAREMSIMVKLSLFMIINTVTCGLLFLLPYFKTNLNKNPNYSFSPGWYVTGGQTVLMMILGDLLVVNLGLDLFRPADLIRRRMARFAKTQGQMNELYACPGEGVLPFRLCVMCKSMVVGTMFSFAMPVLHIVIAAYMWMGHWVDRYTFLRRVTPPPASHELSQMGLILTYFLPIAVLLHGFMAVRFLSDICRREGLGSLGEEVEGWLNLTAFAAQGGGSASRSMLSCGAMVEDAQASCIDLDAHFPEQGDDFISAPVSSLTNIFSLGDTVAKEAVASVAGVPLSDARIDLSCWLRNATVEALYYESSYSGHGLNVSAAICVDTSASSGSCSLQMEQSGAYIFLIVNASFWGIILVLFIINNVGFFRRRLVQERLERMKILKTSAHLDLWRFLVQRDVRDPKIKPAPPNAQVRAPQRQRSSAADPIGGGGHRHTGSGGLGGGGSRGLGDGASGSPKTDPPSSPRNAIRQKLGSLRKLGGSSNSLATLGEPVVASASGGESVGGAGGAQQPGTPSAPPQLKNDALMYLPPLTVHLLNSYYDNSNTSNRMLASYLEHYVAQPILSAPSAASLLPPSGKDGATGGGLLMRKSGCGSALAADVPAHFKVPELPEGWRGPGPSVYESVYENVSEGVGRASATLYDGTSSLLKSGSKLSTAAGAMAVQGGLTAGGTLLSGGAKVMHTSASATGRVVTSASAAGRTMLKSGAGAARVTSSGIHGASQGAAEVTIKLQDNVKKLKLQLALLEGQLNSVFTPRGSSGGGSSSFRSSLRRSREGSTVGLTLRRRERSESSDDAAANSFDGPGRPGLDVQSSNESIDDSTTSGRISGEANGSPADGRSGVGAADGSDGGSPDDGASSSDKDSEPDEPDEPDDADDVPSTSGDDDSFKARSGNGSFNAALPKSKASAPQSPGTCRGVGASEDAGGQAAASEPDEVVDRVAVTEELGLQATVREAKNSSLDL